MKSYLDGKTPKVRDAVFGFMANGMPIAGLVESVGEDQILVSPAVCTAVSVPTDRMLPATPKDFEPRAEPERVPEPATPAPAPEPEAPEPLAITEPAGVPVPETRVAD